MKCINCFETYEDGMTSCPHCGYTKGQMSVEGMHLDPGSILAGRYHIGRVLGFGGFGVTYLAFDDVLNIKVAIKEYLPSEFSTRAPGLTEITVYSGKKEEQFNAGMVRFVDEAKRLARFQNEKGIVRVYDSFTENGTAYIVMELLEGITLAQHLATKGKLTTMRMSRNVTKKTSYDPTLLPEEPAQVLSAGEEDDSHILSCEEAIALLAPVMNSLIHVHEQGIIHRDIAPDNIMVMPDHTVKLIDFGAARYATTSHSRSMTVIIKPGYSPEEQYRSRGDQGPYTDVYAMGAVLYKMITGVTPVDAMERRACIETGKKDPLLSPTTLVKDIPKNVETAVLNALNVRIEDRTPTMEAFLAELTSTQKVKRNKGGLKRIINPGKWPLWAKIGVPAGIVAVVTLLVLFFTGVIGFHAKLQKAIAIPADMTRVPSLVNEDLSKAEPRLSEAVLLYQIDGYQTDNLVPADMILKQSEGAGSVIAKNSLIFLTLSKGAETARMIRVIGLSKEEAERQLVALGFVVDFTTEENGAVAGDCIISQSEPMGAELAVGSRIDLVVSLGKEKERKPELVDTPAFTGKTYEEALQLAKEAGLYLSVSEWVYSEKNDGIVLSQSVDSGAQIYQDNVVYLTVSKGRQSYIVPDVKGFTREEAEERLTSEGFLVKVVEVESETFAAGVVMDQDPAAKTEHDEPIKVTLTVSAGGKAFSLRSVVGMNEEEAKDTLQGLGLSVAVEYQETNTEQEGKVLSQTPEKGTDVKRGDTVHIVVATRKTTVEMPDVSDMTYEAAKEALEKLGLYTMKTEQTSETVPEGKVISQSIEKGKTTAVGTTVVLTVSEGREKITVLDVTGKSTDVAKTAIEKAGLTVKIEEEYSDTVVSGLVISQTPGSGKTLYREDEVTLVVSKGKAPVKMPDLVGKSKEEALGLLSAAGLTATVTENYSDTYPAGTVISQTPGTATEVAAGSKVSIVVSLGKAKVPVTSVELNQTSVTLSASSSWQLVANCFPVEAADNWGLTYTSANPGVATVSSTGLVNAVAPGSTQITVTAGSGVSAVCTVTVTKGAVTEISIMSKPNKLSYYVGEPFDATGLMVWAMYENSTTELVTDGLTVTADTGFAGNATATVTYQGKSAYFDIVVIKPALSLSESSCTLDVGQTKVITYSTLPENASVSVSSTQSYVAIATPDSTNKRFIITAMHEGDATMNVTMSYMGKTYVQSVDVHVNFVPKIELYIGKEAIYVGDTILINTVVYPADTPVTWYSSNAEVAVVYDNGILVGLDEGECVITGSITVDGKLYSESLNLSVYPLVMNGMSVYSSPTKTQYKLGETTLDPSGLVLAATYNNGKTEYVTSGYECYVTSDMKTTGPKSVQVIYNGWSAYFTIFVNESVTIQGKSYDVDNTTTFMAVSTVGLTAQDLTNIGKLKNATSITMENCNLTDISFLSSLDKLKTLYVANNNITSLSGIADRAPYLSGLDVSNNALADYSNVAILNNVAGTVTYEGNPLASWSSWETVNRSDTNVATESQNVVVSYNMVTYLTSRSSDYARCYRNYSLNGNYSANGARSSYGEFHYTGTMSASALASARTVAPGGNCSWYSWTQGYNLGNATAYEFEEKPFFVESENKETQYRWKYTR